jgi:hypothetical protein
MRNLSCSIAALIDYLDREGVMAGYGLAVLVFAIAAATVGYYIMRDM